jgi:hypothetical protein
MTKKEAKYPQNIQLKQKLKHSQWIGCLDILRDEIVSQKILRKRVSTVSPNFVGALVPAVRASLVKAVLAL